MEEKNIVMKKPSIFKEIWRRLKKNPTAMIGLSLMLLLVLVAVFADQIVPYSKATELDLANRLQWPSAQHWFGTDGYGRDVFARIVHGSRYSLSIGFLSTMIGLLIGGFLGILAAYYGGLVDSMIMRIADVLVAIPTILLSLAIVSALGASVAILIGAIAFTRIPVFTRVIRSAALNLVDQDFIEAAKAGGTPDLHIIIHHIIPNAMGTILVQTTMSVAFVIMQAATLSFLGMGIQAPAPEWGYMLNEAREFAKNSSYLLWFPGMSIVLAALSCNLLGDGLRDALDPKLKN